MRGVSVVVNPNQSTRRDHNGDVRIVLGLLDLVERDGAKSQRRLAAELGIALGLVNFYLKRCVKKGLVKMNQAPARRYAYYLTPEGFAEKSRLTVEYLSTSLTFFRHARADCTFALQTAHARGWTRIVLAGISDLAEITAICALQREIRIVAVVDRETSQSRFVNLPVVSSFESINGKFDGVIITDVANARETWRAAVAFVGSGRVLAPSLLGVHGQEENRSSQ